MSLDKTVMMTTLLAFVTFFTLAGLTQEIGAAFLAGVGLALVLSAIPLARLLAARRRKRAVAASLGLEFRGLWGHTFEGELADIGKVRAVAGAPDDQTGLRLLKITVGSLLPPVDDSVAHALVGRAGDEWTYRDGGWHLSKESESPDGLEAALELGLSFAHITLATRRMSAELRAALANPAALRSQPGSPLWQELREVARSRLGDAATIRLASLLRDPTLFGELAQRDGASAAEAFSEMMRLVPASSEARAVIDAWIARRDTLSVDDLRRLAIGLRDARHPQADEVLAALLAHSRPAVRLTAITSLHDVGTPASVPALTRVLERGPADERQLAGEALTAIKQRTRGAPSGGLALVEHVEEGGLSLAPEDAPGHFEPERTSG